MYWDCVSLAANWVMTFLALACMHNSSFLIVFYISVSSKVMVKVVHRFEA